MSIEQRMPAMRSVVILLILTAAGAVGGVEKTSTAQQIERFGDTTRPLAERVARAHARASSLASREGRPVMVGYEIVVRATANEIWGMYSLDKSTRPTLAELIDGHRFETSDPGSRSDSDRLVERRAAVLIQVDAHGQPVDVHLYTLNAIADDRGDTIVWLGDVTLTASFDLLLPYVDVDHDLDVRRGAVFSLARHGLPDRAMPVLTALIRDSSEPNELRKAAIYGLGMLGSTEARRTLLDLIHDETS